MLVCAEITTKNKLFWHKNVNTSKMVDFVQKNSVLDFDRRIREKYISHKPKKFAAQADQQQSGC